MDVSGHPITIRRVQDSDTVYIHGGESHPCFELLLDDEAVLSSVKRQIGCFMDDNPESRDIVRAAYKVAQMYGARTLTLTDNSSLHCPETVRLSDLSYLTMGRPGMNPFFRWNVGHLHGRLWINIANGHCPTRGGRWVMVC